MTHDDPDDRGHEGPECPDCGGVLELVSAHSAKWDWCCLECGCVYTAAEVGSRCGIHVTATSPCKHCSRARALNAAALEGVIPKPAIAVQQWRQVVPEATKAKAREMYAAGDSISAISRATGLAHSTVNEHVGKTPKRRATFKSELGKRGANDAMWARSSKAMRDEQRTHPLPVHGRGHI